MLQFKPQAALSLPFLRPILDQNYKIVILDFLCALRGAWGWCVVQWIWSKVLIISRDFHFLYAWLLWHLLQLYKNSPVLQTNCIMATWMQHSKLLMAGRPKLTSNGHPSKTRKSKCSTKSFEADWNVLYQPNDSRFPSRRYHYDSLCHLWRNRQIFHKSTWQHIWNGSCAHESYSCGSYILVSNTLRIRPVELSCLSSISQTVVPRPVRRQPSSILASTASPRINSPNVTP